MGQKVKAELRREPQNSPMGITIVNFLSKSLAILEMLAKASTAPETVEAEEREDAEFAAELTELIMPYKSRTHQM